MQTTITTRAATKGKVKKPKLQNRHQVEIIQLCRQAGLVVPVLKDDDQTLAFNAIVSTVVDDPVGVTTVVVTVNDSPNFHPCRTSQQVPFTLIANDVFFSMTCNFSHPDHLVTAEKVAMIRARNNNRMQLEEELEEPRKKLGKKAYYIHLNGPQTQLFVTLAQGELQHFPLTIIPLIVDYTFTDDEGLPWMEVKPPSTSVNKWY